MQPSPSERSPTTPARKGSRALRILLGVVLVVVVVYLLFTVVFPWFQEYQDDPTLEGASTPGVATASL